MTALPDWALEKAACRRVSPRTMYEDAWNDKAGRPAPGLAKALAICATCRVVGTCLVSGLDEPWGVWGGAVPPERGQVRGIRYATDADPLDIVRRLGDTAITIGDDGAITIDLPEEVTPAGRAAAIDQAFQEAWDREAARYGSYADIPQEVQEGLSERHRLAHARRAAQAAPRPATEPWDAAPTCPAGHDLTTHLPSGRPPTTTAGRCRLCHPADTEET